MPFRGRFEGLPIRPDATRTMDAVDRFEKHTHLEVIVPSFNPRFVVNELGFIAHEDALPHDWPAVAWGKREGRGLVLRRWLHIPALLAVIGVLLLVQLAYWWSLTKAGSLCSVSSDTGFDSGWWPVGPGPSGAINFDHQLGAVPKQLNVRFSPTADRAAFILITWRWEPKNGDPVAISATFVAVEARLWSGPPVGGTWSPTDDNWQFHGQRSHRVVTIR